jgi:hypothetical protein
MSSRVLSLPLLSGLWNNVEVVSNLSSC